MDRKMGILIMEINLRKCPGRDSSSHVSGFQVYSLCTKSNKTSHACVLQ